MIMDIIALINLLMRNSVTDILEHKNHVDGKNNYGEDTDNDLLDWSIPSISQVKKLKLIFSIHLSLNAAVKIIFLQYKLNNLQRKHNEK